ncbi:MAG: hypothetical protein ACK4EY_14810 [Flavipsychrobacter sp.]|nr:hypothetical protein [Chitinophagales bacterium]
MKRNKNFVYLLLLGGLLILLDSCASGKGCGCGTDINRAYGKSPKRFH